MAIIDEGEIKAGTLLLSEKPFVYALSSNYRNENCDYCFSSNVELRTCSNCQYVRYCNQTCQREAWSIHKLECKHLKRISPRIVPNAARLLGRLIKILQNGGDDVKSYYAPNKHRMFKDLMTHYSDIRLDQIRVDHFVSLFGVLYEFLDSNVPNVPDLMKMYARMCVNSFNITDEELKSLGTGIYLAGSIFDHSCKPNAVAIFQGTQLNIRCTEDLPSLNWDEIYISYTDTLQITAKRQKELLSTYYFLCQCPRCLDIEEAKLMTAAACSNTHCDSFVEINHKDNVDVIKCLSCKTIVSSSFIEHFKEITEMTELHLQNMKLAYLDVCKVCLNKHQGVLYKLNIQHVRILDSAFESSIDFRQWDDAKKFGTALIPGYRKYLGEIHPLLGILYLKLAKILFYQDNLSNVPVYLKEAYRILKITHGDNCGLVKNEVMPLLQNFI